ncbi:MAG: hypothetical protein AB1757_19960 [Acidobacteriota bacterium]
MSKDLIPKDVEQFILKNIKSVAQLEGLLIFCHEPDMDYSAESLSKRLYISESETGKILADLYAAGFISRQSGKPALYRYQPNPPELRQMIDRVAEIYAKYLVPVTNLIHAKPKTRVQEFADAFKLRKEEEE